MMHILFPNVKFWFTCEIRTWNDLFHISHLKCLITCKFSAHKMFHFTCQMIFFMCHNMFHVFYRMILRIRVISKDKTLVQIRNHFTDVSIYMSNDFFYRVSYFMFHIMSFITCALSFVIPHLSTSCPKWVSHLPQPPRPGSHLFPVTQIPQYKYCSRQNSLFARLFFSLQPGLPICLPYATRAQKTARLPGTITPPTLDHRYRTSSMSIQINFPATPVSACKDPNQCIWSVL